MLKTNYDGKVRGGIKKTSSYSPPPALYQPWFSLCRGQRLKFSKEIKSNFDFKKSFEGINRGNMAHGESTDQKGQRRTFKEFWQNRKTFEKQIPLSWLSHTMAVLPSCNVSLQADSTRGAGGALAGIPAKFGSFYAQALLSPRCKPCLDANLADLWWNSRTSSTIHFPHCALLQGSSAPSFSNLLKSKFIHKWGAGTGQDQVASVGRNMRSHF